MDPLSTSVIAYGLGIGISAVYGYFFHKKSPDSTSQTDAKISGLVENLRKRIEEMNQNIQDIEMTNVIHQVKNDQILMSIINWKNLEEIPEFLYAEFPLVCSITGRPMRHAVKLHVNGDIYFHCERNTLLQWRQQHPGIQPPGWPEGRPYGPENFLVIVSELQGEIDIKLETLAQRFLEELCSNNRVKYDELMIGTSVGSVNLDDIQDIVGVILFRVSTSTHSLIEKSDEDKKIFEKLKIGSWIERGYTGYEICRKQDQRHLATKIILQYCESKNNQHPVVVMETEATNAQELEERNLMKLLQVIAWKNLEEIPGFLYPDFPNKCPINDRPIRHAAKLHVNGDIYFHCEKDAFVKWRQEHSGIQPPGWPAGMSYTLGNENSLEDDVDMQNKIDSILEALSMTFSEQLTMQ